MVRKKCSVIENDEQCQTLARASGLCQKHYFRLRRNGNPLVISSRQLNNKEDEQNQKCIGRGDYKWVTDLSTCQCGHIGPWHIKLPRRIPNKIYDKVLCQWPKCKCKEFA